MAQVTAGGKQAGSGQNDDITAIIPWLGVPVAIIVLVVLGGRASWIALLGFFLFVALGPVLIVRWLRRYDRFRAGGMQLLVVAAVLAAGICATAAVSGPANEKRCVNAQTMTVIPASDCQKSHNGFLGNEETTWYYGGTGGDSGGDTGGDG